MRIAVNTLVVIVLGLVMFSSGMYFLYTIMTNAEDTVQRVSASEREQVLDSFPANQELYVADETLDVDDGAAHLVFGVYNRYDTNLSLTYNITCESCSSQSFDVAALPTSVQSGERRVLQAQISNESWTGDQHVFSLNVTNASGSPALGTTTFRVTP
jgi:hypothetical protein